MKKMLRLFNVLFILAMLLVSLSFLAAPARADGTVLDQVSVALLGHMETIVETTTRGRTNAALLATPIQLGQWKGDYIAGLDVGVQGNVKPQTIGEAGYNWTTGVHFHLSPLVRQVMPKISPNYPALAALEINPRFAYLWRNRTNNVKAGWEAGLGLGWSFGLHPQQ